jgi:hypothetical protein
VKKRIRWKWAHVCERGGRWKSFVIIAAVCAVSGLPDTVR